MLLRHLISMHLILVIILGSVEQSVSSETISKVLYPNDGTDQGKILTIKATAFLCECFYSGYD